MSWIEAIKEVASIARKLDNAELQKVIAELTVEGAKLTQQNAELQEENQRLRDQLSLKEELVFDNNLYWKKKEDRSLRKEAFCPRCWPKDGKAVRMISCPAGSGTSPRMYGDKKYYKCPVCNLEMDDPEATDASSCIVRRD